jgi:predicted dehydrogenase
MGRWHAAAIERAGGVLTAVADSDTPRARSVAHNAAIFATLDDLLASGIRVDVVHICTPAASHLALAQRVVEAGVHVIVEKPLAGDAAGTETLLAAAAERSRLVVPVHQFIFQPGVRRLLEQRARLGSIVRCAFAAATAGTDQAGIDADELVQEILPHPLSLFARFLPLPVAAGDWFVARTAPGELRALAAAGGATLEIAITTAGRPTRAELEITGSSASARADLFHGFAVIEQGRATRSGKAVRPFALAGSTLVRAGGNLASRAARREQAYPGLRELVRRTYDAASNGAPPPIDPAEILAVARARDVILAASGRH